MELFLWREVYINIEKCCLNANLFNLARSIHSHVIQYFIDTTNILPDNIENKNSTEKLSMIEIMKVLKMTRTRIVHEKEKEAENRIYSHRVVAR